MTNVDPQDAVEGATHASPVTRQVLDMLEVRASDELPTWLGERLGELYPAARRRVLRVHPAKACRIKGLAPYEAFAVGEEGDTAPPVPVGVDAALAEAVAGARLLTVSPWNGGARLLATLQAQGEVRYLVELFGDCLKGAATDARLAGLLAVTQRYFDRLVDTETDPLTRLATRRLFHAHVEAGIRRWTASGRTYYIALMDIDRFKRINDDFGHLFGDEILVHFANLLRRTFRAGDLFYRFGGEEFVVVYGVDPGHGGEGVLERFRAAVEGYDFPAVGRVTVSVGFTRIADSGTPTAILIDRADRAVYYSKRNGRNRVSGWEYLVETGKLPATGPLRQDVTLF